MRRLTAWTATSVLVLCFWLAMFFMTGSRQGKIALGILLAAALVWGLFRLVTYKPEHERGAGSLEEVRRFSKLAPLEEPMQACDPDKEQEGGDAARREKGNRGQG